MRSDVVMFAGYKNTKQKHKRIKPSSSKAAAFLMRVWIAASVAWALNPNVFAQSDANEAIDPKSTRSVTQIIDDSAITFRVSNFIARNDEITSKSNVNVTTVSGVVLLTGNVENVDQKQWIEDLAENEQGVRKVVNELRVEKIRNAFAMTGDKYLQWSIKHRLTSQINEWSAKIQVVVYRKIVYLMGVVPADVAEAVTKIASTTRGTERVVQVFEIEDA